MMGDHYNIEQVKTRFNPTYSHAQIFQQPTPHPATVRCTPTYHSTALDAEGYRPVTNQHLRKSAQNGGTTSEVVYKNISGEKKQEELNPANKNFDLKLKNSWYDPAKQELFDSLCVTERYSRERKLADLSSNPVFGGATLEVIPKKSIVNTQEFKAEPVNEAGQQKDDTNVPAKPQQNLVQNIEALTKIPQQPAKVQDSTTNEPKVVIIPTQKQQSQHQYSIKNEVTFGKKGTPSSIGKKLTKTKALQPSKPVFTIIKNRSRT